ncbi:hypothetical protein HU200_005213 [Digitaria exilis]|uniref:DUF629 domain-containing protein n=1 Tax=Digitaria exilis TaxID=1010633 RepID=A0A835FQW8_9POAL|nr:hypothetical protein HU200_005213 [Digitaria exilis]
MAHDAVAAATAVSDSEGAVELLVAAAAAESVREAAVDVLVLDHKGYLDAALARARDLMLANQGSAVVHRLLGELNYATAVRAACAAEAKDGGAVAGGGMGAMRSAAGPYLAVARDALASARRLAPNCVDVAAVLGDAFAASRMYAEAESEYRRALSIPDPSDPALHNATYGMFDGYEHERDPAFAAERVEEARAQARASYTRMTAEELVPMAVHKVLEAGILLGAAEGRRRGKLVAETFPNLARARYLEAYTDLEFVRGLDAAIDERPFLRRTLATVARAAAAFPKSAVLAAFHARLLFVLGQYDAAERECRRALDMEEPDDPRLDCVPVGSIRGENRGERLVSLACVFHELLTKILMCASDYWDSMSSERQREGFLQVRFDVLEHKYRKVDLSPDAFAMSDVRSFVEEHKCWRFWDCPICDRKKFMDSGVLLSHMCIKHPRAVLPRLQYLVDPTLSEEALEDGDFLGGVTFCEDPAKQDTICFNKTSDVFKWLFYAPSSGVGAKPVSEMREKKRKKGLMFLESIKEKMKTLPTDKSSTEFSEALPRIQELWHDFLKASAFDYLEAILGIARPFLWRELKKRMIGDPKQAAKWISATDIDAIFTKEVGPSHAEEDHETGDNEQVKIYMKVVYANFTFSQMIIENDLGAELDKLYIDPKIIDNNQESDAQVKGERSDATVTNTELTDPAINMAESGDDPGANNSI